MIFEIPLVIILGIATIVSVFITASFGMAMHIFKKDVFKYHKLFASLTITLAI
ncbi:MAG: hypothetical protein WC584_00880 [Candidatus Pacearchaeota archaeon]